MTFRNTLPKKRHGVPVLDKYRTSECNNHDEVKGTGIVSLSRNVVTLSERSGSTPKSLRVFYHIIVIYG